MGNNIQYDLETACKQGDLQTVKRLAEQPEKRKFLNLNSALLHASENGHLETVKYLFVDNYKHQSEQGMYKDQIYSTRIPLIREAFDRAYGNKHLVTAYFIMVQHAGYSKPYPSIGYFNVDNEDRDLLKNLK